MHSVGYRSNTLVTFASVLLVALCCAASFLDTFNPPSVHAHTEVLKINRFRKQLHGNDEVKLTFNISMDLQSTFTWNTKQVFVFLTAEYETSKNSLNQIYFLGVIAAIICVYSRFYGKQPSWQESWTRSPLAYYAQGRYYD